MLAPRGHYELNFLGVPIVYCSVSVFEPPKTTPNREQIVFSPKKLVFVGIGL